ncbi:MAG: 4-hydroxy-tetrahydrodipicolinate synthase [Deltaproteobacteria bacterium]|nr:4-hydroxy-tetrahydrodipicolinate synthase [Deltaproteobacteria bacterium]
MFSGVFVAIITPFKDGAVDEPVLRDLIEWQISEGIDGIVPCGTTGEAATLTDAERARVIRCAVEVARKRVPVIAGAGTNATAKAITLSELAVEAGADGLLHVTPYYNKPTQEGMYQHFAAVARVAKRPIVLYNVPSRTGVNLLPETVGRLAKLQNIVGLKDASNSLVQATETLTVVSPGFCCLSGEDTLNLPLYQLGYRGAISASANALPAKIARQWDAFQTGRLAEALALHQELQPLVQALFMESNPIPVKTVLAWQGRCREEFRLPLTPMSEPNKVRLREACKSL